MNEVMNKSSMRIEASTFTEVLPIWRQFLWPDRKSAILPYNGLSIDGQFHHKFSIEKSQFFVLRIDNHIGGVLSGHPCPQNHYRVRGLYVFEKFRNQNVATALMDHAINQVKSQNLFSKVWTTPRFLAWPFYESYGFKQISAWSSVNFEFGPNCFAVKEI